MNASLDFFFLSNYPVLSLTSFLAGRILPIEFGFPVIFLAKKVFSEHHCLCIINEMGYSFFPGTNPKT